jgi:hypothetical protein
MHTFTASIELDADQAELVKITAAFFEMDVPTFLAAALTSGIAHAEAMASADMTSDGTASDGINRSGELDDDIPF